MLLQLLTENICISLAFRLGTFRACTACVAVGGVIGSRFATESTGENSLFHGFYLINDGVNCIFFLLLFCESNSLVIFASQDAWERDTALDEYIQTLQPIVYDDFIGTAKT